MRRRTCWPGYDVNTDAAASVAEAARGYRLTAGETAHDRYYRPACIARTQHADRHLVPAHICPHQRRRFWVSVRISLKKGKGIPYSIAERSVPELIPVLGSQPWVIKPAVGCHYFPPGLQLSSQPLRGLLPILLLGEQRHDGCEQFA